MNAFGFLASVRGETIAGDRHHDVPPALQAGDLRGARRPARRRSFRPAPHHADARLASRATMRCSSRSATGCAPAPTRRRARAFATAVQREAKAARTTIGVLDASTLGKIDVRGPDAREFLNRVYTNAWSKLAPGTARYGLMLGEDGMVMDDGVTDLPRRRPLPHDHHDGRRGARARQAGGLSPDRVAGPEGLSDLALRSSGRSSRSAGRSATGWWAKLCDGLDADPEPVSRS